MRMPIRETCVAAERHQTRFCNSPGCDEASAEPENRKTRETVTKYPQSQKTRGAEQLRFSYKKYGRQSPKIQVSDILVNKKSQYNKEKTTKSPAPAGRMIQRRSPDVLFPQKQACRTCRQGKLRQRETGTCPALQYLYGRTGCRLSGQINRFLPGNNAGQKLR